MKATKLIMMFVAVAAMMFASCDKDSTEPSTPGGSASSNAEVVGTTWVGYQGDPQTDDNYATYTLTFNSDNTCAMSIAFYAVSEGGNYATTHFAGTYTVSGNGGTLTMIDDILGEEYNDTYTIEGTVLTLTHKRVNIALTRSSGGDTPGGDTTATITAFDENGASNSLFSVSENRQVRFSRGNLQYRASTNTWRFAEHQWDVVGGGNNNISSTYDGWIDLFGWGTSGWESGAVAYQPYSTSVENGDYYPGGVFNNDLTGDYARADWGVYNPISNGGNQAGMWRTLTADEWVYLLNTRPASTLGDVPNARWAKAMVDGWAGSIIFPDSFTLPAGFNVPNNINAVDGWFPANQYSLEQWAAMEAAGAVFLPAAGVRTGAEGFYEGGWYWTSSISCNNFEDPWYDMHVHALMIIFSVDDASIPGYYDRFNGCSVRLVKAE